jgi:PAS domain S-box-containing protein
LVLVDDAGLIVGWNAGAERLLGYSEKDAVGERVEMLYTPEDRQAGAPEQQRARRWRPRASLHAHRRDHRARLSERSRAMPRGGIRRVSVEARRHDAHDRSRRRSPEAAASRVAVRPPEEKGARVLAVWREEALAQVRDSASARSRISPLGG